ncbi:MAG: sugar phosphate isomerase/epimerase [Ruminococcaceae bacterium]|nr:sugar phosphate isomerase/epimerase [Oscillospiraceae bacterium]
MMEFGLNLYSIRNLIKTEEAFLDTALKLKEMGYSFLQYSGGPYDADRIARVSEKSGMPVVLTHVPTQRIVEDTEALMEEHARFGCKNIGLGAMDRVLIPNKEALYAEIARLECAAQKMSEKGYKFFYHNHHFEFFKHGDVTVLDYMIENAPHINFTLDTFWVQYGGASIADTVDKLKGRIECVHLKDYKLFENKDALAGFEPRFAPVGDGTIDFKALIPKMQTAGVKYFLVEQDNAADLPDTLGQVERSIKYLKENF